MLDISAPHTLLVISSLELPGASQLAIGGDPSASSGQALAYVSSRTCLNPDDTGGLYVINLDNQDQPALLSTPAEIPCGILDVAAQNRMVFLAAGTQGVLGVDVSDPAAPRLAYRFPTPSITTRAVVNGERLYALDEEAGIYVLGLP